MSASASNPGSGAEKIVFCWSGGKDSALALWEIQKGGRFDVIALVTTVSADYDRVCMHGVRRSLLATQAEAIGMPLHQVRLSSATTNAEYESKMEEALLAFKARGVERVAFGDIFLEDLREYRDRQL